MGTFQGKLIGFSDRLVWKVREREELRMRLNFGFEFTKDRIPINEDSEVLAVGKIRVSVLYLLSSSCLLAIHRIVRSSDDRTDGYGNQREVWAGGKNMTVISIMMVSKSVILGKNSKGIV